MEVLGENEALQQFFEGQDVTGALENPMVDISMLEEFISNDNDSGAFILPDSPPYSGSELCSPPGLTDTNQAVCSKEIPPPNAPKSVLDAHNLPCRVIEKAADRRPCAVHCCDYSPREYCLKSDYAIAPCNSAVSSNCMNRAYPSIVQMSTNSPGSLEPQTKKRKLSALENESDHFMWSNTTAKAESCTGSIDHGAESYGYDSDGQNINSGDKCYQFLTWQAYQSSQWIRLYSNTYEDLRTPGFQVVTDKGFNFSTTDDAFVCQKKNHFQVTVHIGMAGNPKYLKTHLGLKMIEKFHINVFGVKVETPSQIITIEQSQSDRSKKPFYPVRINLPGDQITKITLGRLHFSETTANNMRKKGKPNPDQRYFRLVVALYAVGQDQTYLLVSQISERIIVRASNPGQFENDNDVLWQRGHAPESLVCHGRVGINTDTPDEALVVCGNMKVMGTVVHPSDSRAKENIQEVDTTEQLKRITQMRLVTYDYKPEFASRMGIDRASETGLLAQEIKEILPTAVKDVGDVVCDNGDTIENFLMIDKDHIFMENVGAVKELCKLTDNLETRIKELEDWNARLAKLKRAGSCRSALSGSSINRKPNPTGNIKQVWKNIPPKIKNSFMKKKKLCSHLFQTTIITLVSVMVFCAMTILTLYVLSLQEDVESMSHNSSSFTSSSPIVVSTYTSLADTASSYFTTTVGYTGPPEVNLCDIISSCSTVYCCPTRSAAAHTLSYQKQAFHEKHTGNGKEESLSRWNPGQLIPDDWIDTTIKSIQILENHQPIDHRYCIHGHSCGNGRYNYTIPVSKYTHRYMPITLEFNTSEPLIIYYCKSFYGEPCQGGKYRHVRKDYIETSQGFHHTWKLPAACMSHSLYIFRVAIPDFANCSTDINYAGIFFTQYSFYFYRQCD